MLKRGLHTGLSESTLVKMPHCWKSHVAAQLWQTRRYNTIYDASVKTTNCGPNKADQLKNETAVSLMVYSIIGSKKAGYINFSVYNFSREVCLRVQAGP